MDKKKTILLVIAAVVILALIGAFLLFSNTDITLEGTGAYVTVPSDYELDVNSGVATKDDVGIFFNGILGDTSTTTDFYKAISANGKSAGYENITEDTINGFKVYEYAAKVDNLSVVKYGSSTQWVEYPPMNLTDMAGSKVQADHYRKVYFISPNNSVANELTIVAKNPDTDLYTQEINDIIHSISLTE